MLKPAILALIRQILTIAGTALVAKGLVQATDVEPVIGALLTIGSVVWSLADKGKSKHAADLRAFERHSTSCSVRSADCGGSSSSEEPPL